MICAHVPFLPLFFFNLVLELRFIFLSNAARLDDTMSIWNPSIRENHIVEISSPPVSKLQLDDQICRKSFIKETKHSLIKRFLFFIILDSHSKQISYCMKMLKILKISKIWIHTIISDMFLFTKLIDFYHLSLPCKNP